MYSLFSFRRYSCFGSSCFLVPDRSRTKEDDYPSEGVTLTQRESHWLRGSQNYLRKRKNRTILETINTIMHDHNLSMISWAEECMTQYMFRTRFFTIIESFTRAKLDIEHFRLFGCPVYFHVPKEKKSKLDPLERKDTMNIQRHPRSTSLVIDRLRQGETLSLKKI